MSLAHRSRATRVWAMLVALTLVAFAVAEQSTSARLAATSVILIAAFKVRLVFIHFMELEWRPLPWRLLFELWTVASAAIIIGGYWLALR
jgi:heme/copper-type cytochrome/quinol oxidase subunit 4